MTDSSQFHVKNPITDVRRALSQILDEAAESHDMRVTRERFPGKRPGYTIRVPATFPPELGDTLTIVLSSSGEKETTISLQYSANSITWGGGDDDDMPGATAIRAATEALRELTVNLHRQLITRLSKEQRRVQPLTPDDIIEKFYRAKGQNRKIKLKDICERYGANYASIRVAKVAYDKRRRRKRSD